MKGQIKCVTVKKNKLGDWFIYFVNELENDSKLISMTGKTAGFDFGCTDFLVKDDGVKISSPLFFKQNKNKITKASQKVSSKTKGSNNRKKAKDNLARVHDKVYNQRRDFHFKLANKLCKQYDVMFFETLDIESMKTDHGKKINDMGFSDFMSILEHKALEYGKSVYHVDKWFASTQICNSCGFKNKELTERDRTWICPSCGTNHDRDINAGINIRHQGELETKLKFMGGSSSIRIDDVSLCSHVSEAVVA
jgi:putative transposase